MLYNFTVHIKMKNSSNISNCYMFMIPKFRYQKKTHPSVYRKIKRTIKISFVPVQEKEGL